MRNTGPENGTTPDSLAARGAELKARASAMLSPLGITGDIELFPIEGGANNRVFKIDAGNSSFLLKEYFRHPDDPRDRLGAEFNFSSFAWNSGIRCIPRPFARDEGAGLGLYEFIDGRKLRPGEVTAREIGQALDFFIALNENRAKPGAAGLHAGSEACFTVADHLRCVERRIERLRGIDAAAEEDRAAAEFVKGDLCAAWEAVRDSVLRACADLDVPPGAELTHDNRRLSPSDFGFHNAILAPDGGLRFFDFEYAGWDDPAKLVCDFFCQPQIPAPREHFGDFSARVAAAMNDSGFHRRRFEMLLPVYRVKWACIMINEFLPEGGARRRFADKAENRAERKAAQLLKARAALESVRNTA